MSTETAATPEAWANLIQGLDPASPRRRQCHFAAALQVATSRQ